MAIRLRLLEPLIALVFTATLFGSCVAHAQVVQPTYVRPSKGSAIVVFDTANPADGLSETSVVYDMSAFAEVQFDVTLSQGGTTTVDTYNVAFLGRYIKVRAEYKSPSFGGAIKSYGVVTYTVLGSDTATGTFSPARGPGARQVVANNGDAAITSAKLVLTPLPYTTNQYTRPGKGNTISLYSGQLTAISAGGNILTSPAIDMRGFAALSIDVRFSAANCRYIPQVALTGGPTATTATGDISTTNSIRYSSVTNSYVVNVPASFVAVLLTYDDRGAGLNCSISLDVTPLPYGVPEDAYPSNISSENTYSLPAGGAVQTIQLFQFLHNVRVQNLGNGLASCGISQFGIASWAIYLSPQTATTGDGGVWLGENFTGSSLGQIYCRSVAGTTIGVFQY